VRDSPRRTVILFCLALLLALGGLGSVLWGSLTRAAEAGRGAENSGDYVAPSEIPSVLAEPSLAGVRAAVWADERNAPQRAAGGYDAEVARWKAWLSQAGAELVAPARAEVLVLPYATCLGLAEREQVAGLLKAGKGIVTVGMLGARNENCHPLPDTLLHALLGAGRGAVAAVPHAPHTSYYGVVLGETALAAGLPPGSRFEVRAADQVAFRDPGRAVFWTNYYRQPVRPQGRDHFDGAMMRSHVGPGRVAAFGFGMAHVVPGWSEQVARRIAINAVRWSAGRPSLQLAAWPGGRHAAAVVAQDVEADYANAAAAVELLREEHIPATFFLLGRLAERDHRTTRRMTEYGEIGSHTFDHVALDGRRGEDLVSSLRHARESAARLSGRPVLGLRPPAERFNLETLRAWAAVGGDYVFAANNVRAAGPELVPLGADTVVLLARVVDDDFQVLERAGVRDRATMSRNLLRDLDEVIAERGLYMFSYHSQLFARPELMPVLRSLAEALHATPEVWVAPAGEVARWWRARAAVRLTLAPDYRTVRVDNTGAGAFDQGVLLVELPGGAQSRLAIPPLAAGASVSLALPVESP
jgi:peptidoglycan/xylan/chitin deacetylase (PgdA/CDA1 family)